MATATVTRHRTAIHRTELSRPIRVALNDGLITQQTHVFDYGCGYGDDIRQLQNRDIRCNGWDPTHRSYSSRTAADIVNIGYVINVIEDPSERKAALREAWDLSRRLLIVSARLTAESREAGGTPYADGFITRLGTFQKFYEQHELRDWIENTLGVPSIPAAPGIFYIFRDQELHHCREPQISYLSYPDFERDPHPSLFASMVVPLRSFHIHYRENNNSSNPPILHRKEEFVSPQHPLQSKFARLTQQEEKHGLLGNSQNIGTKMGWEAKLMEKCLTLSGHRLIRMRNISNPIQE